MEECAISVEEIENCQSISRTEEPDCTLKFWKVENLNVKDENGFEYRFGDIYQKRKTIIIFLRNFLCHMCKEYVDDAAIIPPKYFRDANVNFVLIGCAESKFIKPFREATGYQGALYVDENRELYNAIGLYERAKPQDATLKRTSPHIKSGVLKGIAQSTWRGMKFKQLQGDMKQQGGALILGPGNIVHHQHFDLTSADHAPLNDLLIKAGVEPVNFPGDQRVITI